MSHALDVLVIGAGPAGLATSRELSRAGVSHVVVERGEEAGHTWANLYDGLVLHTTRRFSTLPDLRFPPGTPRFPTRLDLLNYLQTYARTFSVPIRPRTHVISLVRQGHVWRARTESGDEIDARAVVVAAGIVANPNVPDLSGRGRFSGRVIHSVEYRRPDPFAGHRVLVVGAGNSAADIAVELDAAGADVTLAVRSGATVMPLEIAGVPIQYFGFALAAFPRSVLNAVASVVGKASSAAGRTAVLPAAAIKRCTGVPIIGLRLSDAIREGKIRLKRGITELESSGARFDDGTALPFDTVILATGYRAAVSFLPSAVRLDPCGFPERSDTVTSADQQDLYFVGHNPDIRGGLYRIGRDARRAAARLRS